MIINDLDDYYIVIDTKNRNTELDTLVGNQNYFDYLLIYLELIIPIESQETEL